MDAQEAVKQTHKEQQIAASLPPPCGRCGSGLRTFYGEWCAWCRPLTSIPQRVPRCPVHHSSPANWGAPTSEPQRCSRCRIKDSDVHRVNPCRSCRLTVASFGPPAAVAARCRSCSLASDQLRIPWACQRCGISDALWGGVEDDSAVHCGECKQPGDQVRMTPVCQGCRLFSAHWGPPASLARACRRCRHLFGDTSYYPVHRRCSQCTRGPANRHSGLCRQCNKSPVYWRPRVNDLAPV